MKLFIFLTFITLATSALARAKTENSNSSTTIKVNIEKLHLAIANAKHREHDKSSKICFERANFYYKQAKDYHRAGWTAKAKDFALRGTLLIELHQRTLSQQEM